MKKYLLLFLFTAAIIVAQEASQTFLSLKPTGVQEFLQKHPDYDGRGTIVFILDTGVDMGVDGLTKTSTGETKVIDVQDFTGQGDVPFYEADEDDEDGVYYFVNEDLGYKVAGADKLELKAVDDDYYIGQLNEELWKNSSWGDGDVNGNGSKSDGYNFVTFQTEKNGEKFWVVYFDVNGNNDISDEKPIRNYKENFDLFEIPNENGLPNFAFGLNIFPDEKKVVIHFDDGAHGTHCAGISTGNRINNGDLYGVAPGAYIISLKLGIEGSTVSESMKKCYLYADKVSREREEPCIINMSFGVGSEIEGHADIEKFLNDLVDKNPYLYICTSNGNEGPGISTSGLPSASDHIFSSGAVLTKEVGSDMYGATLDQDVILHFSSRGGEVSKPDVVSPGACESTVPNWAGRDRMWGTSMASPYSSGVMALLLSAARAEYPDVKIPSRFLFKVVRESAVPLPGYNHVDQGGGYINVPNAWALLKKYIDSGELKKFETYSIYSFAPNMPGESAPNIYIRNGAYLTGNETFRTTVVRDNFQGVKKFYRIFKLKSDKDWLIPVQKNIYIKNDQPAAINVKIDRSKLNMPGLYNGKITAYRSKTDTPEFEFMAAVVIPYEFNSTNNYRMEWTGESLKPGLLKRYYINVPAGASSMRVRMSSEDGKYTTVWYHLHAPDGRQINYNLLNSLDGESEKNDFYYNLIPGVYELVMHGFFTAKNVSDYNLLIEFNGLKRTSPESICKKNNAIELVNTFDRAKTYSVDGSIVGYKNNFLVELDGADVNRRPFVLRKGEASKSFKIAVSKEDFNKTTDFNVKIFNEEGYMVTSAGLSYKDETIVVRNSSGSDSTKYILEIAPAFSNAPSEMKIFVEATTKFKSKQPVNLTGLRRGRKTFYPSLSETIYCNFEKPDQFVPAGAHVYGMLNFTNATSQNKEIELPIFFKF